MKYFVNTGNNGPADPRAIAIQITDGLTTETAPHEKFVAGRTTYYFTQLPEGDFDIHRHEAVDQHGYGGALVGFLMTDGSVEVVRGPYHCTGLYDYGAAAKLAKAANRPEIALLATRLTIARTGLIGSRIGLPEPEPIYQETEWQLGIWQKRLRTEWRNCHYRVVTRAGTRYGDVNSVLDRLANAQQKAEQCRP